MIVAGPGRILAHETGESILVVVRPGHEIVLRITSEPFDDLRLLLTSRARRSGHEMRFGLATPWFLAGPLTLAGSYADLQNPMGVTAGSDRWFVPARASLDGSLVPASRAGVVIRPVPWAQAFVWRTDTLTIGAAVRGTAERAGASAHVELIGSSSRPVSPADVDPRDRRWFEGRESSEPVAHAMGRLVASTRPVRLSLGATASLPRLMMPGVLLASAAEFRPTRRWTLAAAASLASPDFVDPRGRRPRDAGQLSAALSYDGPGFSAATGHERAYVAPDGAYLAVGFAPSLDLDRSRFSSRVSVRPVQSGPGLRSVGVEGSYDALTRDWRLRAQCRLVAPGEIIELLPATTVRSDQTVVARLRAVGKLEGVVMDRLVPGASLQLSFAGEYERRSDRPGGFGSSVELSFRVAR